MTMQAQFTFVNTSVGSPDKSPKIAQWQWKEGGSQCSVECGHHGLSMKYETASTSHNKCPLPASPPLPPPLKCEDVKKECGISVPSTRTHHVARPYERRCKSTAHITLQQVDEPRTKSKLTGDCHHRGRTCDGFRIHRSDKKLPTFQHFLATTSSPPPPPPPIMYSHHPCPCLHCVTLHTLVTSLSRDCQPCYCHQYSCAGPTSARPPCPSRCGVGREDSGVDKPREATPVPTDTDNWKNKGLLQKEKKLSKKLQHSKRRPKTIHIDVYCTSSSSSSSEDGEEISDRTSSSDQSSFSYQPPIVALGSKKSYPKNNFKYVPSEGHHKSVVKTRDSSSYSTTSLKGPSDRLTGEPFLKSKRSQGRRLRAKADDDVRDDETEEDEDEEHFFMTDYPMSLCQSSISPAFKRPASSPAQVQTSSPEFSSKFRRYPYKAAAIPLLPPPVKPTTLAISPIYSYEKNRREDEKLTFNVKKAYSDSTKLLHEDYFQSNDFCLNLSSRSDSNLTSLHEAFGRLRTGDSTQLWRSPKLERKNYLLRNAEERYNQRRTQSEPDNELQTYKMAMASPPSQCEAIKTPTKVSELAKLSVFQDFSHEELQVISKSLTKRETERSLSSLSGGGGSRTLSRQDSFIVRTKDSSDDDDHLRSTLRDTDPDDICLASPPTVDDWNVDEKTAAVESSPKNDELSASSPKSSTLVRSDVVQSKHSRPINVGFFRRYAKFPFNLAYGQQQLQKQLPSNRYVSRSNLDDDQTVSESRRQFVRPSVFGLALKPNSKHGLHFGPPRNPQCFCLSCKRYFNRTGLELRSKSLTDLSPVAPDEPADRTL